MDEIKILQKDVELLTKKVEEKDQQILHLSDQLKKTQNSYHLKITELGELKEAYKKIDHERRELKRSQSNIQQPNQEQISQLIEIQQKYEQQQQQLSAYEKSIDEYKKQLDLFNEEIKKYLEDNKKLSDQVVATNNNIEEIKKLEMVNEEYLNTISILENELNIFKERYSKLQEFFSLKGKSALDKVKNELIAKENELYENKLIENALRTKLKETLNSLEEYKKFDIFTGNETIDDLRKKISELTVKFSYKNVECSTLRNKIKEIGIFCNKLAEAVIEINNPK